MLIMAEDAWWKLPAAERLRPTRRFKQFGAHLTVSDVVNRINTERISSNMSKIDERKLVLLERDIALKEKELQIRQQEAEKSTWTSPLIVAIIAASIAALGNAFVAFYNAQEDRIQTILASENARILEVIKTGGPRDVKTNLEFLIDSGLVTNERIIGSINGYYKRMAPGVGPGFVRSNFIQSIQDTAAYGQVVPGPYTESPYSSICSIRQAGTYRYRSGVLIGPDLIVTLGDASDIANSSSFSVSCGTSIRDEVLMEVKPIAIKTEPIHGSTKGLQFVFMKFRSPIASKNDFLIEPKPNFVIDYSTIIMAGYSYEMKGLLTTKTPINYTRYLNDDTVLYDTGSISLGNPIFAFIDDQFRLLALGGGGLMVKRRIYSMALKYLTTIAGTSIDIRLTD